MNAKIVFGQTKGRGNRRYLPPHLEREIAQRYFGIGRPEETASVLADEFRSASRTGRLSANAVREIAKRAVQELRHDH